MPEQEKIGQEKSKKYDPQGEVEFFQVTSIKIHGGPISRERRHREPESGEKKKHIDTDTGERRKREEKTVVGDEKIADVGKDYGKYRNALQRERARAIKRTLFFLTSE